MSDRVPPTLTPDYHPLLLAQERAMLRESFPAFLHYAFHWLNQGSAFLPGPHLTLISEYLQAIEQGVIRRLIINMPPRYLKSLTVSVAWPAWLLGQNPARRIIVASYAEKLSLKHSLDCRHLLQSPWFARSYPQCRLLPGQNEKHKFVTEAQGFRLAASIGGTLTGEGGDILIMDDPINPLNARSHTTRETANQWFEHTFSSRLNDKQRGAMVLVMQRLHAEDLSGYLQQKGGWEVLELPAIAPQSYYANGWLRPEGTALHPAREDILTLHKTRHEMGSHAFAAQYQQTPQRQQGSMVPPEWLITAPTPPLENGQIVQSWDTALKTGAQNDPSVGITALLSAGECHLLEVMREKLPYHRLRSRLLQQAERWQPQAILIEDKASGQSLLQDLRHESALPLIPITPRQDKVTRFAAITPLLEAGRLFLPPHAPWRAEFEQELLTFPDGKHDDQVDALSQLLQWWQRRQRGLSSMELRRV